jgi:hypothetical protein
MVPPYTGSPAVVVVVGAVVTDVVIVVVLAVVVVVVAAVVVVVVSDVSPHADNNIVTIRVTPTNSPIHLCFMLFLLLNDFD